MRRVAEALWTSLPRSRASSRQLRLKCVSSAVSSVRADAFGVGLAAGDRPTVLRHERRRKRIVGADAHRICHCGRYGDAAVVIASAAVIGHQLDPARIGGFYLKGEFGSHHGEKSRKRLVEQSYNKAFRGATRLGRICLASRGSVQGSFLPPSAAAGRLNDIQELPAQLARPSVLDAGGDGPQTIRRFSFLTG